jgi:class 3 adenylate cyclase/tetratricopeptide (TPR) repeat protein
MSGTSSEAQWPIFRRAARTVVVVDLVESVRLIEQDEEDTVRRWQAFVGEVVAKLLPPHGGRLVKSLGDGLMVEFEAVPSAIQCAIAMQTAISQSNQGRPDDRAMWLRVGAHVADVIVDERDIYGAGVNLAARLTTLAGPGEIVVSAEVRDGMLPGVDGEIEDLGDFDLKGIAHPVRAFRVARAASSLRLPGSTALANARATIAVLPLDMRLASGDVAAVGEILADDVIVGLSASPHWHVISRLSAMAFQNRRPTLEQLSSQLHATYVLSGHCVVAGTRLRASLELADTTSAAVIWAGDVRGTLDDLMQAYNPLAGQVIEAVSMAIFEHELEQVRAQPLPTLRSHSLLYGAIGLMHRLSRHDFERSLSILDYLAERHPRAPEPRVWMAKWHVLRITQGWSADPHEQARAARACVQRALEHQQNHALGLAIDGLIAGYLNGDLETSERRYAEALSINPNESLAWLYMSALHAYRDRGDEALRCANTAIRLSPLDPMRYFYDSFLANALLAAGQFDESIAIGHRSIRANCTHMPTYRSLAIAQVLGGHGDEARMTMGRLLATRPGYSLDEFKARYAGRNATHAQRYADALREAGLPEH